MNEDLGRRARSSGAHAVAALRRATARKAAELIQRDPNDAATALEIGLVDHRWLAQGGRGPISSSAPSDMARRYLERSEERRPSKLSSLGLSLVRIFSSGDGKGTKLVTVVFTDLEGFTAFTDANGDEAALALLEAHHRLAGPIVRRWNGTIVKHLGDGLLCSFPDPESGVRAALELLDTAPAPLRLRAGAHVGHAMVSRLDIVGHVVNVAARVCDHASADQVLVTAEVVEEMGPCEGMRIGRTKTRRLKGIRQPVGLRVVTATAA
ncbi:MAG: adenylate/guanylate cyclase domain-containing protein [Acidimicrobiales bacterium]